jgi:hypothetical protein
MLNWNYNFNGPQTKRVNLECVTARLRFGLILQAGAELKGTGFYG